MFGRSEPSQGKLLKGCNVFLNVLPGAAQLVFRPTVVALEFGYGVCRPVTKELHPSLVGGIEGYPGQSDLLAP